MSNNKTHYFFFFVTLLIVFGIIGCNSIKKLPYQTLNTLNPTIEKTETPNTNSQQIYFLRASSSWVDEEDRIFLLGNDFQIVKSIPDNFSSTLLLSSTTCELIDIFGGSNQLEIKKFNINGEIINNKKVFFDKSTTGYAYYYSISPDEKWVAMKEASSDWGYSANDANVQDIELVSIDSTSSYSTLIKITENGGAHGNNLSWSRDNRYIAFTDYDNSGITQIYLFDTQKKIKIKVSEFTSQHFINNMKWSSTNILAVSLFDKILQGDDYTLSNEEIMLFSIPQQRNWIIRLDDQKENFSFWWGKSDLLLILSNPEKGIENTLIWYDVENQNIETTRNPYPIIDSEIYTAFPIEEDLSRIAILGSKIYIYDLRNNLYSFRNITIPENIFGSGSFYLIENSSGSLFINGCW